MSDTRVKQHPTLKFLVCTDGHIMVPATKYSEQNWTYGTSHRGYMHITRKGRKYYIHRLVAETFLPNPNNLPTVDHIDRNPSNNRVENLRWASRKTQSDNTASVDRSLSKYGIRYCDDPATYNRLLRHCNPEYAEKLRKYDRERMREYRKKQKERICLH